MPTPFTSFPISTRTLDIDLLETFVEVAENIELINEAVVDSENSATVASAAASSAITSASTATTQADSATASASSASTDAATAITQASNASSSAALAQQWAANPEDDTVPGGGGLFSGLHYAAKAAEERELAQDWAEGTEPGGPGTKSSKEWSEEAEAIVETIAPLPALEQIIADAAEQVVLANAARTGSEAALDATVVAAASIGVYKETTLAAAITAGLAAATEGQGFHATGDNVDYIGVYKDVSGVAVEQARYLKSAAFDLGTFVRATGDRRTAIKVSSSTSAFFAGTGDNLVDGDKTASAAGGVRFTGANAGRTFTFDFGAPSRLVFNSVRLWWDGARNQGVVKAQGSVDGVTWSDLSGNLNWGQSLTADSGAFYQDFPLTILRQDGRAIGYRYFRIAGVSGSAVAIEWLLEVEFETAPAWNHNSIAEMAPVGGVGQVLAKATSAEADVYWRDVDQDTGPRALLADIDRLLASERYSEARFHADSVYGNNANDGLSSARAKQTITGLMAMSITKDSVIGLRADAVFDDKTIEPASGFKKLVGFGDGALPLLDCAPAINPASFSPSGGTPGTYEITLTREAGGIAYVNDPQYTMWEVATDGARRELVPRASAAQVLANPGSVFFVSRTGASTNTFVLPFDSTDPRSDGKTYKASILKAGVGVNGDGGATTNPAYDGQYIEGIHASGQVDGHGSILSGDDTTMKGCLASYGNKHNIIFKSGYAEDSIAYGWGSNPVGGCIPWTVFRFDAEGRKARLKRCMSIATATEKGGAAFYAHGSLSPDGLDFDEVVLDQFVSADIGNVTSSAKTQRYRDLLFLNLPGSTTPIGGIDVRPLQPLCEIDRMIFWAVRGTGFAVRRPTAVPAGSPASTNLLRVRNCVLAEQPGSGTVSGDIVSVSETSRYNIDRNIFLSQAVRLVSVPGSGSVTTGAGSTITGNIFLGNRATNPQAVIQYPAVAAVTVDFNVYVMLQNSQIQITNSETPTTYTISTQANFDAYKAATGKDTNSVLLTRDQAETLFVSGVTGALAGDLRLNPNCPLLFTDGQRLVDLAGPSEHLDWNKRAILPGPPRRIPRPPVTLAECDAYCRSPAEWNWYP